MKPVQLADVLIVGSGPAGLSTALHLVRLHPGWASRVVVIDKAVHPRPKLCGGGISQFGVSILQQLDLSFDAPHVVIDELRIIFGKLAFSLPEPAILRITRRDEFDHWLVKVGQQRGIDIRQGEEVLRVVSESDYMEVTTSRQIYRARVVVAADGAFSTVKRQLNWRVTSRVARLLEVLTPEKATTPAFNEQTATFDFTPMMQGLQGYYWDFPSRIQGEPFMNRGVFDSRVRPERNRAALKALFADQLAARERQLDDYSLEGHPIPWLCPEAELARSRVLLVGDAAGAEPLFGEGIAFALAYGEVAALEINEAFTNNTFAFTGYRQRVLQHSFLRQLSVRTRVARLLHLLPRYPWLARFLWKLTPFLFRSLALYRPGYIPMHQPRLFRRRSVV